MILSDRSHLIYVRACKEGFSFIFTYLVLENKYMVTTLADYFSLLVFIKSLNYDPVFLYMYLIFRSKFVKGVTTEVEEDEAKTKAQFSGLNILVVKISCPL